MLTAGFSHSCGGELAEADDDDDDDDDDDIEVTMSGSDAVVRWCRLLFALLTTLAGGDATDTTNDACG